MLKMIPHSRREAAIRRYCEVYREAGFAEEVPYARSCTATRAANTWLREHVESRGISKPERR